VRYRTPRCYSVNSIPNVTLGTGCFRISDMVASAQARLLDASLDLFSLSLPTPFGPSPPAHVQPSQHLHTQVQLIVVRLCR
jgi:hypothetical protein